MFKKVLYVIGRMLLGKRALMLMCILVFAVAANVTNALLGFAVSMENDLKNIYDEQDDIAALFLGIGLLLKERRLLQRIFCDSELYSRKDEQYANELCAKIGINLILIGTAMRISVQLTKIPEHVISSHLMEIALFSLGAAFCVTAIALLSYLTYRLSGLRVTGGRGKVALEPEE